MKQKKIYLFQRKERFTNAELREWDYIEEWDNANRLNTTCTLLYTYPYFFWSVKIYYHEVYAPFNDGTVKMSFGANQTKITERLNMARSEAVRAAKNRKSQKPGPNDAFLILKQYKKTVGYERK